MVALLLDDPLLYLVSVDDLKKKIHSFRTQIGKELRLLEKSRKSGSGTDDVYKPTYEFFHELLFLQPVITARPSRTNAVRNAVCAIQPFFFYVYTLVLPVVSPSPSLPETIHV